MSKRPRTRAYTRRNEALKKMKVPLIDIVKEQLAAENDDDVVAALSKEGLAYVLAYQAFWENPTPEALMALDPIAIRYVGDADLLHIQTCSPRGLPRHRCTQCSRCDATWVRLAKGNPREWHSLHGRWAFVDSCKRGMILSVKYLLGLRGDRQIWVHPDGSDALLGAIRGNHIDVLKVLLGLEGDRKIVLTNQHFGVACASASLDTVKFLVDRMGKRVVSYNSGIYTPLERACLNDKLDTARFLVGAASDPWPCAPVRDSTFTCVCDSGFDGIVSFLLSLKGDHRVRADLCAKGFYAAVQSQRHAVISVFLDLDDDRRIPHRVIRNAFYQEGGEDALKVLHTLQDRMQAPMDVEQ